MLDIHMEPKTALHVFETTSLNVTIKDGILLTMCYSPLLMCALVFTAKNHICFPENSFPECLCLLGTR